MKQEPDTNNQQDGHDDIDRLFERLGRVDPAPGSAFRDTLELLSRSHSGVTPPLELAAYRKRRQQPWLTAVATFLLASLTLVSITLANGTLKHEEGPANEVTATVPANSFPLTNNSKAVTVVTAPASQPGMRVSQVETKPQTASLRAHFGHLSKTYLVEENLANYSLKAHKKEEQKPEHFRNDFLPIPW